MEQRPPGRGWHHAAPPALQERDAQRGLHAGDAGADRSQREMGRLGAARDAAALDDGGEEAKVNEIEAHRVSLRF